MRTLLVLRGAPGAGKSTWVRNNNLEQYTLCPDIIRMMCSSCQKTFDGQLAIARNQRNEAITWKLIFQMLEYRFSRGEFTVLDATASKTSDMCQYKDLAAKYRYTLYCVDFTDVPIEVCLKQNKMRPEYKWVPEEGIRKIYARFKTQKVPSGYKIIKPDELNTIKLPPVDLSEYKKLVFIGDIHGCYDTLMQYPDFKDGLKDDTEYIFCGDYVDRGNQNGEVMHWLNSIMDKPNVCLLEGNHEKWIRDFGQSVSAASKEFEFKTKPQLEQSGYTPKMARMFYRKCRQLSNINYRGINILACHGGVPEVEDNILLMPTANFIDGVGTYNDSDIVADLWEKNMATNQYLVHGHRNISGSDIQVADRVFNLEGQVEFGGHLRIVELDENLNWTPIEIENNQPIKTDAVNKVKSLNTVEDTVNYLRNNKYIQEKKLTSEISSFNFTREAFYKSNWNVQTILARGLFIDVVNNKIMARSYEKFFRINERPETELSALHSKLKFPVAAYKKENGFLAIVSYDYLKDDLFVASKSVIEGDYPNYIRENLMPYKENLLKYLKYQYFANNPVTMVFECIRPLEDPHIIKYDNNDIVLLDIIKNTLDYEIVANTDCYSEFTNKDSYYKSLVYIASQIGCAVKEKAYEFKSWEDFLETYYAVNDEEYQYNDTFIEGFVFEDTDGFMTKCKSGYYNLWKQMRGVADRTLKTGYYGKTGTLDTDVKNLFYGYCRDLFTKRNPETKTYNFKTDIINLRENFLKQL